MIYDRVVSGERRCLDCEDLDGWCPECLEDAVNEATDETVSEDDLKRFGKFLAEKYGA